MNHWLDPSGGLTVIPLNNQFDPNTKIKYISILLDLLRRSETGFAYWTEASFICNYNVKSNKN